MQDDSERVQPIDTIGFGEAGDEQDWQFGAQSPDPFSEFDAIHSGHRIIDDGGVEISPLRQDIERRHASIGFDNAMTQALDQGRGHIAHAGVIIDQQYRQRPRRN